jgi:ubiquitin-conjugating enzyme E2 M
MCAPVLGESSTTLMTVLLLCKDPNPEDPLNKEAAEMFQNNQRAFESMVAKSISHGANINGMYFPPCRYESHLRRRLPL